MAHTGPHLHGGWQSHHDFRWISPNLERILVEWVNVNVIYASSSGMEMNHNRDRLSPLTKLAYGVGDTGFSLTDTTLGVVFLIFLLDVVGLEPAKAAMAIFIPFDHPM